MDELLLDDDSGDVLLLEEGTEDTLLLEDVSDGLIYKVGMRIILVGEITYNA